MNPFSPSSIYIVLMLKNTSFFAQNHFKGRLNSMFKICLGSCFLKCWV